MFKARLLIGGFVLGAVSALLGAHALSQEAVVRLDRGINQNKAWPNKDLQPLPYSRRSFLAPAFRRG